MSEAGCAPPRRDLDGLHDTRRLSRQPLFFTDGRPRAGLLSD
jgi:hypothetical protein